MEDAPRLTPPWAGSWRPAAGTVALLALALATVVPSAGASENPVTEVTRAIQGLGAPGALWGRLAVEEESPAGPWTPLVGVEVTLYPATPTILGDLERIRQSTRTSGAQYQSAVSRIQAALAAYQASVDAQSAGTPLARVPEAADPASPSATPVPDGGSRESPAGVPGAGGPRADSGKTGRGGARSPSGGAGAETGPAPAAPHPFRQVTDRAGLFAFDAVPAGEWLVVAIRLAPYSGEKLRSQPQPRASTRRERFLPRERATPTKEAELWIQRVRIEAGERVGLTLTDRARWLVGPTR